MTRYAVKAPNGRRYEIDGPEGASEEEVRAQVLAQHPDAERPSQARLDTEKWAADIKATGGLDDQSGLTNLFTGVGKKMTDWGLGARQAAADVGFGDREALAKEAAEKERIDAPLMNTTQGKIGAYGTDIVASLLPQTQLAKVASAAKFLPSSIKTFGPSVATGALQSVLTPEKDYSLAGQAASGAAGGFVGDVAGRTLGRALNPRVGASQIRRDDLGELGGMPRMLAENLTDDKTVKTLTNTMSQMGPVGWGVNKSRAANLGQMTEDITGAAGNPVKSLTATEGRQMMDALTTQIEGFKQGPRVKLHDFPNKLAPALAEVGEVAAISGGSTTFTRRAMGATQGTPSAVHPFTRPLQGQAYPNYPPIPKDISAKDALVIRSRASDAFHGTDDWVKKEQYMLLRDEMDKAIVKSRGTSGGQDYLDWKKKYDAMKHIEKAGISKEGNVLPEDFAATLTKNRQIAPRTPLERETVAGSRVMGSPSLSEPRSLAARTIMGSLPYLALGGGSLLGGPLGAAASVGTMALAHKILGTPGGGRYLTGTVKSKTAKALQSERLRELVRMLSVTGGAAAGHNMFK